MKKIIIGISVMVVCIFVLFSFGYESVIKKDEFRCDRFDGSFVYELKDGYIAEPVDCGVFIGVGPMYWVNYKNQENLDNFDVVYSDDLVGVYDFNPDDEFFDEHTIGEVFWRVCKRLDADIYMAEVSGIEKPIDRLSVEDFVEVCKSIELL